MLHSANAPASELLDEVSQVQISAKLLQVLNVSAELKINESHVEVATKRLQSMYDEQQTTASTTNTSSIVLQAEVERQSNAEDYCQNPLEELHENPECANDAAVTRHNNSALRTIEEQNKNVES